MTALAVDDDVLNYEIHPVAALFPYIKGVAFHEFVEDIRVNGQREPVVLDASGRLIDGRNRARACQVLGIDVKETRYLGGDAEAWIISHNIHRRHLTESQRAMFAARWANMRQGRPIKRPIGPFTPIEDAAKALNIGTSSVKRAKVVLGSGDADLIKAVESGETSVSSAAEKVRGVRRRGDEENKPARSQSVVERVKQIRSLADKGASSAQIAKQIGISAGYIRKIARENGIEIRADVVRGRVRRFSHDLVIDRMSITLDTAAFSLRDIDGQQLTRGDETQERLDSLTESINAIATAIRKIKESYRA